MTRKPIKKAARKAVLLAWTPDLRPFFGLAAEGWQPPAQIKITSGGVAGRATLEAKFVGENGLPVTLRTRIKRLDGGRLQICSEALSVHLVAKAGGPAQ